MIILVKKYIKHKRSKFYIKKYDYRAKNFYYKLRYFNIKI